MMIYQSNTEQAQTAWDKKSVEEMAATMQDMDAANEAVTPENLRLRGYSIKDIEKYGVNAAHLARNLSVKVVQ